MRIENEILLDFQDVLIRPKRSTLSSRKEVSLERTYQFKHSNHRWTGTPIMAANMDGVGTFEMSDALAGHGMIACLVKSYDLDDFEKNTTLFFTNNTAVSTGTSDRDFKKLQDILYKYPDMVQFICIDVANGYSEHFGDYVAKVRKMCPEKTIIAGNVVTADMTQELILRGADIVKVGIGPGSVCTTRIQTGVGYPQLSAIIECADAAHGLGAHIIADGGCTCPGDVAKAFGAGCFTPDTIVHTANGPKPIRDVLPGDSVLTHMFRYRTVNEKYVYTKNETLLKVNNIKCTKNHHFYVVHKDHADSVNEGNIHEYAKWIPAEELTMDYYLIEI
jgi:GMP reductase